MSRKSDTDWKHLAEMDDEAIATDDIPELDRFFLSGRGCVFRPSNQ
ncbi:hypothetical protein [Marinobacter bryozoorum]